MFYFCFFPVKPKFKVRPVNTTAIEGHSAMIHCLATGEPTPTVQWDRNNKINDFDYSRFKVSQSVLQVLEARDSLGCYLATSKRSC